MAYVSKKDHVDHDGLVVVLGKNKVIRSVLASEAKPSDRVLTPQQFHDEADKKGVRVEIVGFVPAKTEKPKAEKPKAE